MATKNSINSNYPIYITAGGTGVATLTDHGVLVGSGTGAVTALGSATNGQLIIGSTGADPVLASLTSTGGSITITPGAGTINLEAGAPALGVAFRAKLDTSVVNVTGDGTDYLLICDSEQFDIGSDYNNSTGIFTAPQDGKYMFIGAIRINNGGASDELTLSLKINSDQFSVFTASPTIMKTNSSLVFTYSYFVGLSASDTVNIQVLGSGGTLDTDIIGASSYYTYFSGYLVG